MSLTTPLEATAGSAALALTNTNINAKELMTIFSSGTIDSDTSEIIFVMTKTAVNKIHEYKITPPSRPGGRWSTYYKANNMTERKKITSTSEQGLYAKLKALYFSQDETLEDVFRMWQQRRCSQGLSPRTLVRDRQRWIRYFATCELAITPISQITSSQLEGRIYDIIHFCSIKSKEVLAISAILKGCFKLAVKEGLISNSPMDTIEINKAGCAPNTTKNDKGRVYSIPEQQIMFEQMSEEIHLQPTSTQTYAILLNFKLGLRIGELVALKFSDIDYETKQIHIQRMESLDAQGHPIIVEHLKKKSVDSDRYLPLDEYSLNLLDRVRQINSRWENPDNFIFINQNGRFHIRAIDNRIRKLCKRGGIEEKSCHDIRRTVASTLHRNGVSIEQIRSFMGHSDVNTTWSYIYDIDDILEKNKIITGALASMNAIFV